MHYIFILCFGERYSREFKILDLLQEKILFYLETYGTEG